MSKYGYYYLHVNGDLFYKPDSPGVEDDFSNSDFVKHYWKVDFDHRADAWRLLVEALASGANPERVLELAEKWNCTETDAIKYAQFISIELTCKDFVWRASKRHFNGKKDDEGFGSSPLYAMADLCKNVGFKPSNVFRMEFWNLLHGSNYTYR